jgi:hypothetical protein
MMAHRIPRRENVEPSIVLIGVPNVGALERVMRKLKKRGILYEAFFEPDYDIGLSAVATYPLADDQRDLLRHYNIWREGNNTYGTARREETAEGHVELPTVLNDECS